MNNKTIFALSFICMFFSKTLLAEDYPPEVLYGQIGGDKKTTIPVGVVALEEPYTQQLSGCTQIAIKAKLRSLVYSKSGVSIEQAIFDDSGDRLVMPIDFSKLSNVDRRNANRVLIEGQYYFMRAQICGSGQYPSLIDIIRWSSL